jgi:macrolide transport system ATP-binding/permease protein
MGTWLRRLAYLFRQSRHDAELREEIEAHRALRAEDLEQDGLTPPQAAAASRRAIGNVLLAREDAREVWLGSWATWSQDVRYGLRTLRRSPAFTAVAVLTLALGIGVNTGIFSVVNAVLFRNLSAPGAHELVSLSQTVQGVPDLLGEDTFSTSEYLDYRDRAQSLSGLAAYANVRGETTLGGDIPRTILGVLVSCNYFGVLQQPPALGRALAARDCEPGADLVVVLSHDLWRTVFEAEPGIVGRTIELNRRRITVAGVAAEGTYNGSPFLGGGFFAPLSAGRGLTSDDSRYDGQLPWLTMLGRQRDGVGLAQVRAELDVIAAQIDQQRPGRSTRLTIGRATPALPRQLRDGATGAAAVLMTAFGFILLIACANVANLLLARGTSRSQEIGIRVSLGATRARVVRQLVAESLLLAAVGGVLGSMVALWSIQALIALAVPVLLPPELPLAFTVDVSPDVQVLGFAMALTLGTGLLFGLAPAWHVSKPDLHAVMKQDSSGAGSRHRGRLRGTLVGVQVALCMVLMIAAGLLLRGLQATYTIDPSFESRNIAYVSLESAFLGYSPEASAALRQRLMAEVESIPGVDAVAYAMRAPLALDNAAVPMRLPSEREDRFRATEVNLVTPDYFSLLGISIVRGRTFTEAEVANAGREAGTRPAIVSQTTARNFWPGRNPIGRTLLSREGSDGTQERTHEVVGVAADARVTALGTIDPYYVYQPGGGSKLLVKSRMDVGAIASSIRQVARKLDPSLIVPVLPLEGNLGWWRGLSGMVTTLFGGLGVLALVLASVGIYGVVSYAVTGRYREIGVRLALGATASNVLGLILRQTLRPVVVGAAIGLAAASAISSILSSVLFGVSPVDPAGLGGAALLVLAVSLAAGVMAARPATRADPTATLRYE